MNKPPKVWIEIDYSEFGGNFAEGAWIVKLLADNKVKARKTKAAPAGDAMAQDWAIRTGKRWAKSMGDCPVIYTKRAQDPKLAGLNVPKL